jgi:photosystem II stability/assembly factor-like uncharacterized protein
MTNAHRSRWSMRGGWLALLGLLGALLATLLAGCGAQAGSWRLIGPTDGAHVYTLAADPTVAGLIYAGGDNGAVYRGLADQTGDVASGAGIPQRAAVASVLPDPAHAGAILAGTSAGLYRSPDYGDQWSAYGAGLPTQRAAVALAATPDDATLLAGLDGGGVYRSLDLGAHWTKVGDGLPAQASPVALAWDAPADLWLLGLNGATGPAIYASADSGQRWTPRSAGLPSGAQVNALALLGGSAAPPALFAATSSGLFTSADGGQSWNHVGGSLPAGSALALATLRQQPTWLYVSVDSGVYRSTDGGAHWQVVAPGLTTNVQGLVVTEGKTSGPVVFAAVGQVARYPTGVPSGSANVPTWLPFSFILIVLVGGGYFLSRRSRRFGYAMGAMRNEANTGRSAEEAERWQRERQRPPSGVASGPTQRGAETQHASGGEQSGKGRVIAPSDLTSRASTGLPANQTKAAQNGHGKPKQRK